MKRTGTMIAIIIISFIGFTHTVFADNKQSPLGFTVAPIFNDNQLDENLGYFYIQSSPGVNQEVKVKVNGYSETPVKVKVSIANAITGEKGTMDYDSSIKKDDTLVDSLNEIATVDSPEFEIKKGESKIVTVSIHPPASSFAGIKLATIVFDQEKTEKTQEKQTAITNTYGYRIGLMVTEEGKKEYRDSMKINLLDAKAELTRRQKTVVLTIQNPEPKMVGDFTMKTQIVRKSDNKVLKQQTEKNGSMAPNSRFEYAVDWGLESIPAGTYIAKVTIENSFSKWNLEKEFTITEEKAKQMNTDTVVKLTLPTWIYVVTVISALLTGALSFYLIKRRSSKASE